MVQAWRRWAIFDDLVKKQELDMLSGEFWLTRISKLRVYNAKGGPAPHKPLLLLVLLEMAEQGLLPEKTLHLTPELGFRFDSYWASLPIAGRSGPMCGSRFIILRVTVSGRP